MADTQAHTSGPWLARKVTSGAWFVDDEATGDVRIAHVLNDADARLIAAAPDLLECLILALQDCEQLTAPPRSLDIYRAAIRKARGGAS